MKNLILPTPAQRSWGDAELGVIIHLDVQVFEPDYNFRQKWGDVPDASVFNPASLDTDQWIRTAVEAGATYAVLAAKHCSGFSLWPTRAHGYSVASSPWKGGKGDVVGDFVASCRKFGVKPGIYASASVNAMMNVDNPGRVRSGDPEEQRRYNDMVVQQLTELWSDYGELFEIWFDGGVIPVSEGGPDIVGLIERLQPNAAVFQGPPACINRVRDSGNELSTAILPNWSTTNATAYQHNEKTTRGGDPDGDLWAPTECDIPNRKSGQAFQGGWFWRAGDDPFVYSSDDLVEGYFRSVGQNANLLIGMVIDNRGLSPDADVAEFREFGRKIRGAFSSKVASVAGEGEVHILNLPEGAKANILSIQEDVGYGERVREFVVEALTADGWATVWTGSCIGHKRLERFAALETTQVRLAIIESAGAPVIREFSAWRADESLFTTELDLAKRGKIFIGRNASGLVDIRCTDPTLALRYTVDGSEPGRSSTIYTEPFPLPDGGTVRAQAYIAGGYSVSNTAQSTFGPIRPNWRVVSVSFDSPYKNGGIASVDKLLDDDPRTYWHTYSSKAAEAAAPHEVTLDMGEAQAIRAITYLPRTESIEGAPDRCEFWLSVDGENWNLGADCVFDDLEQTVGTKIIALSVPTVCRYIRFVAKHVVRDGDYVVVAGIGAILAR